MALFEQIKKIRNEGIANEVGQIFKDLQLPEPQDGEYLRGNDGWLVFLNKYGCVLRIEDAFAAESSNMRINHPLVLQPIGRIMVEHMNVEICPGVKLGVSESQRTWLKKELEKDHIQLSDSKVENLGFLNVHSPEFPEGLPVVIDQLAVTEGARAGVRDLWRKITGKPAYNPWYEREDLPYRFTQAHFIEPLRAAFDKAWPLDEQDPQASVERMNKFWKLCEHMTTGPLPLLHAGWNDIPKGWEHHHDTKPEEAMRDGRRYAIHLEHHTKLSPSGFAKWVEDRRANPEQEPEGMKR